MEQQTLSQAPPPSSAPPKNWLVESILVTIFCCLPFGIAGIVFASQVNSKWAVADYNGALQASKEAAKWTKIGFFVSIGCWVLYLIAVFALGLGGFWMTSRSLNQ